MNKLINYNGYVCECAIGGKYTIIDEGIVVDHKHLVKVEFHNKNIFGFNTVVTASASNAVRGQVKDIYAPNMLGVACTGDVSSYDKTSFYYNSMYNRWQNIIKKHVNSGYILEPDWRCFEYFLRDVQLLPGFTEWMSNPNLYTFDRDYRLGYKFDGFTRESCSFVHFSINANKEYIRLAQASGTYVGVRRRPSGSFEATFSSSLLGTFSNELAAASMYNHCARRNGYVEEAINNLGASEMSIHELLQYRVEPEKLNGMTMMMTPFIKQGDK